jgi:hypothetical protein
MIRVSLFKMQTSGWSCDNPDCKHDPKYHHNIIGKNFHLKENETVLAIYLGDSREIYCRDCIDEVYKKLKPVLDSKLWVMG